MDIFQETFPISEIIYNVTTSVCLQHLLRTGEHWLRNSLWALKMVDASSKIPQSLLMGNIIEFGNFDECISVKVNESWGSFEGQHCLVQKSATVSIRQLISKEVIAEKDAKLLQQQSICVPSTCSVQELNTILKSLLRQDLAVDPLGCHTSKRGPLEALDWLGIGVLLTFAVLCFFSTVYDILTPEPERRNRVLLMFSVPSNAKKLFAITNDGKMMNSMSGIRVLSMAFIVLGHEYFIILTQPAVNYLNFLETGKDLYHVILEGALLSVDTFFVMSGCLLCYIFLNTFEKGKKFNLFAFYLHRYIRLTPLLAVLVILHLSLVKRVTQAPLWDITQTFYITEICQTNWWGTLLYVSNYINTSKICIPTSWYLAVDMQLFWISPIFLLTLRKWPRIGVGIILVAVLTGIGISFQGAWVNQDTPNIIRIGIHVNTRYFQTHNRFVPWLLGLLLGYIFYRTKDWRKRVLSGSEVGLPRQWVVTGWTLSAAGQLAAVYTIYPMIQNDWVYNRLEASLYIALSRPVWSLGICWIIFACVSGYGGVVNTILSWKVFQPLGRLSYAVYLVHFQVILSRVYSTKIPFYLSDFSKIGEFFGDLALSTLIALILTLMIESPLINLEKILLRRDKSTRQKNGLDNTLPVPEQKPELLTSNIIPSPPKTIERQTC